MALVHTEMNTSLRLAPAIATPPERSVAPAEVETLRQRGLDVVARHRDGKPLEPTARGRVRVDGKFFSCDGQRFPMHGVSYGTFAPRAVDGAQFPEPHVLASDLDQIAAAGFTVVRTYTSPTDDLLERAAALGLRVLAGVYFPDWRYLIGAGRRDRQAMVANAETVVRREAKRLAHRDEVMAVVVGNEVPADAMRWFGSRHVESVLSDLVDIVHDEDPDLLVTYANYPTSEYLDVKNVDFLTYNVFLERQDDLRRYLTRLHHQAADRPLVLGEIGLHAGDDAAGEDRQAAVLDWQLATALERGVGGTCLFSWTDEWWVGQQAVEGWHFGLTREDRSPRPALRVAAQWNRRTVADLDYDWPSISVAICAYNAADTLEECLRETTRLDYPNLEILVVDDGSTDATAGIAYRHPKVKLVSIEHGGLSVARNACIAAASGDLIAYLDSDAYPTQEWPYYLALGLDGAKVGGVGGPNVPPRDDPAGAHRVAAAPGGPVHVLVADDRAEHVPGCNMAFWKTVLGEVGGFDPVYTAAGDDVDVCWKVLDRGWEIGFHPAALVWHHRRPTIKAYLKQQRGYGKAEALVAARHPDRYTSAGTARWRGRIYSSVAHTVRHQRIYRGSFGGAAFQSLYGGGGHAVDLAHQVGVPFALGTALAAVVLGLLVWHPVLWLAATMIAFVLGLGVYDAAIAEPPRGAAGRAHVHRGAVGLLHLVQPLARRWGRWRHRAAAQENLPRADALAALARRARHGVLLFTSDLDRPTLMTQMIDRLRRARIVVLPVTGWEDHDGRIVGSALLTGELLSSSHTDGVVQVRVRRRVRRPFMAVVGAAVVLLSVASQEVALVVLVAVAADLAAGVYRTGWRVRRILGATR